MAIPRIDAASGAQRPFWSVMIPTYRPRADYLARALASVTAELQPGADVHVEIVDDASPGFDPERFLADVGVTGIRAHRNDRRLGLAGNWNACVGRAQGRWVHLLHQDDFVLPGYYTAMRQGIESGSRPGAAFCDAYFVTRGGVARRRTLVRACEPGVLRDWIRHVFVQLAIQTPAMVVRRDVYEVLGGYDDDFAYALDWDMWKRIAARYPIWYEPRALAVYQLHGESQTARLRRTGRNLAEINTSIERSTALLPDARAREVSRAARRAYSVFALENVFESLIRERDREAAAAQWREARSLAPIRELARAFAWLVLRTAAEPLRRKRTRMADRPV